MPIYKTDKKKDGLFVYNVRVNYTDKNGKPHSLTRSALGATEAKLLEAKLTAEYKTGQVTPTERMTVGELCKKYIETKKPRSEEPRLKKRREL